MNVEYNRQLQQYLAPLMKAAGYLKERATWRCAKDESILVFNIQGSQFGPDLFLNLAVYYRALGTELKPLEYECHLRARLNSLVPDPLRLIRLLDFGFQNGDRIADEVRCPEIKTAVEACGLPWLNGYATLDQALLQNPQGRFHVSPSLRQYLSQQAQH